MRTVLVCCATLLAASSAFAQPKLTIFPTIVSGAADGCPVAPPCAGQSYQCATTPAGAH